MKTRLFNQTKRDDRTAAQGAAERYSAEHPGSPAATQQPKILVRGGKYVALLGSSISGEFLDSAARSPPLSAASTISTPFRSERTNRLPAVHVAEGSCRHDSPRFNFAGDYPTLRIPPRQPRKVAFRES